MDRSLKYQKIAQGYPIKRFFKNKNLLRVYIEGGDKYISFWPLFSETIHIQ